MSYAMNYRELQDAIKTVLPNADIDVDAAGRIVISDTGYEIDLDADAREPRPELDQLLTKPRSRTAASHDRAELPKGFPTAAWILKTQWGWSLFAAPANAADDGLVASSKDAAGLWPLAQSLGMSLTA